ncbi:MAG TPA: DUF2786 domain-containing protein [Trebonia sp.]
MRVLVDGEVPGVGKASRLRRQQQEKERQQRRGAANSGAPGTGAPGAAFGFGPSAGARGAPTDRDQAANVVAEALTAVYGGHDDAYAKALTKLASERTPAWTQAVSRGVIELLRMSVARAWRAGWQPAELTRHAGRELSQEHVSVAADMIIGEMRQYPAVTVDRRWAAQVAAVRALSGAATAGGATGSVTTDNDPWWENDGDYLAAWQRQARVAGGLRDAIATAIELLNLLQRLPILEQLLPLPGTARAATTERAASAEAAAPAGPAGPAGEADERMLSRIRALLTKAESTEYAEEAEALSARAQELMAKYSISQALLAAESGRKDDPAGRRIAVDNPYEAAKVSLLQAVAMANRSRVIWSKEVGLATVVGFDSDLDAVELLFTSLLVQASSAMLHAGSRQDAHGRSRTRAFRQSFLLSYAIRIGERLSQAAEHATKEAAAEQEAAAAQPAGAVAGADSDHSAGALVPFLATRRRAVDDAVDEMFGDTLRRGRSLRATDAEGWASGRAAADLATLHNHAPVRQ